MLNESKQRYPHWKKLVYGVFMASRKLKHYFLGHPITVVSSAPLGDIIKNREATSRVAKWAIELGPHGLNYVPRTTIKSQALVDFRVFYICAPGSLALPIHPHALNSCSVFPTPLPETLSQRTSPLGQCFDR